MILYVEANLPCGEIWIIPAHDLAVAGARYFTAQQKPLNFSDVYGLNYQLLTEDVDELRHWISAAWSEMPNGAIKRSNLCDQKGIDWEQEWLLAEKRIVEA